MTRAQHVLPLEVLPRVGRCFVVLFWPDLTRLCLQAVWCFSLVHDRGAQCRTCLFSPFLSLPAVGKQNLSIVHTTGISSPSGGFVGLTTVLVSFQSGTSC